MSEIVPAALQALATAAMSATRSVGLLGDSKTQTRAPPYPTSSINASGSAILALTPKRLSTSRRSL